MAQFMTFLEHLFHHLGLASFVVLFLLLVSGSITTKSVPAAFTREALHEPVSVNYHFTRMCNKSCGFCFHTNTSSFHHKLDTAKRGLRLLADSGMRKINFAGGEPFLYAKHLGEMLRFCKQQLQLESCSIVSNGSLITEKWLAKYGQYVDILAVSCDSFNENTNIAIGRGAGDNVAQLFLIRGWCEKYNIKFKLNTVVCRLNVNEDMTAWLRELQPFRWKCFQVLMVKGENDSDTTKTDVRKFQISDEKFEEFCEKHKDCPGFVPEPNRLMAKSYLILDEQMRFLDRDGREPSGSILDVGVQKALDQVFWDKDSFLERGGIYDWGKEKNVAAEGCGGGADGKKFDW